MHKAFSLIELLISLIIISLIIAAFAPIMTKKLKYREIALSKGALVSDCSAFDDCIICDSKNCTLCNTQLNPKEGYYVNPKVGCEYQSCSANCKICNSEKCLECNQGFELLDGKCASCLTIGNICVAKFNAGDLNGLKIPSDVEIVNTSTTKYPSSNSVCWQGRTASNCNSINGGYNGCTRTVCSWYAANRICSYNGWRLPKLAELASFGAKSINKGSGGLQLCDHYAGYNSATCENSSYCRGSRANGCAPDALWALESGRDYYLHSGYWGGPYSEVPIYGFSVRCVKDL